MKITLNTEEVVFEKDTMTVTGLLEEKKLSFRMRMVKINGRLIKKDQYDQEKILDGDDVQVIYLMSGG
jgi:sulfur carrier protein